MNFNLQIPDSDIARIQSIANLQSSIYHDLDIPKTLEFFFKRYVEPISKFIDISDSVVVDCGTGHGWFSIAYIMAGGKAIIAADIDSERLVVAKKITEILSVDNKIYFIESPIHTIPLSSDEVDFFVSIETLEHVGKGYIRPSLIKIRSVASKGLLITTPNKIFPVIAHDTRLPFAHWLPQSIRRLYAKLFNREDLDDNNEFLFPWHINIFLEKFKPASSCLTFKDYSNFKNHYPFYLPYGSNENGRMNFNPSTLKAIYYWTASTLFRNYSYWVMPSMAHIFLRR